MADVEADDRPLVGEAADLGLYTQQQHATRRSARLYWAGIASLGVLLLASLTLLGWQTSRWVEPTQSLTQDGCTGPVQARVLLKHAVHSGAHAAAMRHDAAGTTPPHPQKIAPHFLHHPK